VQEHIQRCSRGVRAHHAAHPTHHLGWVAGMCAFGFLLGDSAKELRSLSKALPVSGRHYGDSTVVEGRQGIPRPFLLDPQRAGDPDRRGPSHSVATGGVLRACRAASRASLLAAQMDARTIGRGEHSHRGCSALGGVFAWLGVVSQGVRIDFSSLLGAGLNTASAGLCLLGLGFLAWGTVPRATSSVVYGWWRGPFWSSFWRE